MVWPNPLFSGLAFGEPLNKNVRCPMQITTLQPSLRWLIPCVTLALLVAGCDNGRSDSTTGTAGNSSGVSSAPAPDSWLGKWNGPEGTFLLLAGGNGIYQVTIQNLDGPQTFAGHAAGNQIAFDRNGVTESLRPTNGAETGMKWLSEKSNCLTVRSGEGYCRD